MNPDARPDPPPATAATATAASDTLARLRLLAALPPWHVLVKLAERHPPPQSWFDEPDDILVLPTEPPE